MSDLSKLPEDASIESMEIVVPRIQERIAMLKQSMEAKFPDFPNLLREVHSALKEYPDTVHFLEPEERAAVVQACFQQASVSIQTANKKSGRSSATGKKLKDVNEDDI